MASNKRYTRKQLKQPDEFIAFSQRALLFAKAHLKELIICSATTAVVVGAFLGWTTYRENMAEQATSALSKGLDIYNQTVIDPESGEPSTNSKAPGADDEDAPHFTSQEAKLSAALKAFGGVIDQHGSRALSRLPLLMQACSFFDQGNYAEAEKAYRTFLKTQDHPLLRQLAQEGLAYALEAQQKWDDALATIDQIGKEHEDDDGTPSADRQLERAYQRARIFAARGKTKEAVAELNRVIEQAQSTLLVDRAGTQLAQLEHATK